MCSSDLKFSSIRSEAYNMLGSSLNPPSLSYRVGMGDRPYAHIEYNDNRDTEMSSVVSRYINGY